MYVIKIDPTETLGRRLSTSRHTVLCLRKKYGALMFSAMDFRIYGRHAGSMNTGIPVASIAHMALMSKPKTSFAMKCPASGSVDDAARELRQRR